MEEKTEPGIIKEFQAGKKENFGLIYDSYLPRIYRFIYYKTLHKETAEDLTSQTFLKVLENMEKFDAERPFAPWIYRIAQNSVIDYYRTKKVQVNLEDVWDLHDEKVIATDKIDQNRTLAEIRKHFSKLSSEQRDVLILRVWEDMPYKDIAEIMGKSEASCKMAFTRAISRLRDSVSLAAAIFLLLKNLNI